MCISPAGLPRTNTTTWIRWWLRRWLCARSFPASRARNWCAERRRWRRSDQQGVDLSNRAGIEFHPAVIGHQAVHLLLHIVELRIADSRDLRDTRDGLIQATHAVQGRLLIHLHAGV